LLIPEGQAVVAAPPAPPPAPLVVAIAPPLPPLPAVAAAAPAPERISVMLLNAGAGVVIAPGRRVGGYGSAGFDALFNADRHLLKPVWGLSCAWEFFGIPRSGGGGFNLGLLGGLKSPTVVATVGVGVNAFTFDSTDDKRGGGILSPRARAQVGFLVGSFHFSAVAQAQRRWQWGSEDITLFTAGLALGGVLEEREPG
jgi:hypothetical protein